MSPHTACNSIPECLTIGRACVRVRACRQAEIQKKLENQPKLLEAMKKVRGIGELAAGIACDDSRL